MSSNAEYLRRWKKANPEKVAEYARRDAKRHPDRMVKNQLAYKARNLNAVREYQKTARRKKMAALSPEEKAAIAERVRLKRLSKLEALAGSQKPERCEICNDNFRWIVFDHCHQSGKFRGWLCDRCNKTLGHVKDDPSLLRALAAYLEKSSEANSREAENDGKGSFCGSGPVISNF